MNIYMPTNVANETEKENKTNVKTGSAEATSCDNAY